jgi:hypothetical protein
MSRLSPIAPPRRTALLLAAILLLLVSVAPATAAPASGETGATRVPPADSQADGIWRSRMREAEAGNQEKADALIERLLALKMEQGRRNLHAHAAGVITEAIREADAGHSGRARVLLGFARRLAPDYPAVYRAEAYLVRKESPLNLMGYTLSLANDFRARFGDPRYTVSLIGRTAISLAISIVLWAFFWSVGLVATYGGLVFHDARERVGGGKRLVTAKARTLAVIAFIGPLALVFPSPVWLISLGIIGSWFYQSEVERRISLVVVLLLALLPFPVWVASTTRAFLADESTRALMNFSSGEETPGDIKVIGQILGRRPSDESARFALAQQAWRLGNVGTAEELYRSLGSSGSLRLQSTVNLGVILTARKDLDAAESAFREALSLDATSAAAHFNLGQVLNMKFRFQDGESELRQAVSLDDELMSLHSAGAQGKSLMLERLPPGQIVRRLLSPRDLALLRPVEAGFWPLLLTNVPAKAFPVGLLLLSLLAAVYVNAFQGRGSRRCGKCRRPLCPLCSPSPKATVCQQCQSVFMVKEGVESSLRVEKMVEIKTRQRHRRIIGMILSATVPGSGQTFLGYPVSGAVTGLLLAPTLALLLGWSGMFTPPTDLPFAWPPGTRVVGGMLFAVLYPLNLIVTYFMARGDS